MKLQQQTLWVIGGSMFVFLLLLTTIIRPMLLEDALSMDEAALDRDLDRIERAIVNEGNELNRLADDWAQWDDTYEYVNGRYFDFVRSNINQQTFENNHFWRMIIINNSNQVMLDRSYGYRSEKNFLGEGVLNLEPSRTPYLIKGENTFFYAAVKEIYPNEGRNASGGKFLVFRPLNADHIAFIGRELSMDLSSFIKVVPSTGQNRMTRVASEDILQGFLYLNSADGESQLAITVEKNRNYYLSKKDVISKFVIYLIILLSVIALVLFLIFDRLLVSRISSISTQLNRIEETKDFESRVSWKIHNGDEIHRLGTSINGMLTSVDQSQREVYSMAQHDQLTGLLNRYGVYEEFKKISSNPGSKAAFIFFDLDGFKRINDSLGHKAGDLLLKKVSKRLKEFVLNEKEIIARMGGDEFLMLAPCGDADALMERTNAMLRHLKQNYSLGDIQTFITTSVGVAIYPQDGETFDEVLQSADIAMYEAKRKGKNQFVFYHALESDLDYRNILTLENDLKFALKNKELYLDYQPVYTGNRNRMTGVEALIRWNHPEKGLISPSVFVPIAENGSFISDIGEWVMEEALRQHVKWREMGLGEIGVAINVSKMQMKNKNRFLDKLDDLLSKFKVDPSILQIEITESDIFFFDGEVIEFAATLQEKGVRVALDDFGVGTSTLFNLKKLPVDVVKIDRSFVQNVPNVHFDTKLLSGIYQVLEDLGFHVITEGVETKEQVAYILSNSDSDIQGYYFSRPVKPEQIALLLEQEITVREAAADQR
ncbi:bifunctional diguanylate cyclase/phosphodiesterase [Jeotgalibacillus aurantiacus]|uniref:bifunctional diguanylate cyclase/phosphodiesterase n=1 Tax=Jeotgalibacillus aurantiacus TaxID=2763266 RepID=UPI001D0AC4FB|nr:EAL domain-containing protein [Jeotgalibacillus aurantiacus]